MSTRNSPGACRRSSHPIENHLELERTTSVRAGRSAVLTFGTHSTLELYAHSGIVRRVCCSVEACGWKSWQSVAMPFIPHCRLEDSVFSPSFSRSVVIVQEFWFIFGNRKGRTLSKLFYFYFYYLAETKRSFTAKQIQVQRGPGQISLLFFCSKILWF